MLVEICLSIFVFDTNGVVPLAQGCGPTVRHPGSQHPTPTDFLGVEASQGNCRFAPQPWANGTTPSESKTRSANKVSKFSTNYRHAHSADTMWGEFH